MIAVVALGISLLVIAALLARLILSERPRTSALLRLDWYLPFWRKRLRSEAVSPSRFLARIQTLLPGQPFGDRVTGRRGWIHTALRWLGPSVSSSPARRLAQAVFFVTFLLLFFHVCWPYRARPAPQGAVSSGWTFREIDQTTGHLLFVREAPAHIPFHAGQSIHVVAQGSSTEQGSYVGQFEVIRMAADAATLSPQQDELGEVFDRFLTGNGPWTFCETRPGKWPSHYADDLAAREAIPAELFLVMDPLVSLSTAIASRSWVWSLVCAAIILVVSLLIPRGFCGYICPLGTLIDLFDWAVGRRVVRWRVGPDGWWVHLKYYVLAATLVSALMGVLISGVVAAIPVVTRGMLFLFEPLQSGALRGWHLVPAFNAGHIISIVLFVLVLALGFLRPRFWCKYVCPSGALFSVANVFRVVERKVEATCIHCNKCIEICPFDAIKLDFTTRGTDCTLCQTCAGVCPTYSIKFVERWNHQALKKREDPPTGETTIGRRGFLSLAAGSAAAIAGGAGLPVAIGAFGARLHKADAFRPVRPPGSVPEPQFLQMCIRCGECFKVCPNNVLQAEAFQQGFEGLWAPLVNADWAGCESSCNACGQVCPTGAIRALSLDEKRAARMGLAVINHQTCLPFAGREACDLCVVECSAAGYHAIEYTQVGTQVDAQGAPIEGTGFLAPVVIAEKCVGCGLCQTRCHGINVKQKHLLDKSAILVEAGTGKEDRLMSGSYVQLRKQERRAQAARQQRQGDNDRSEYFVPGQQKDDRHLPEQESADPFGVENGESE